MSKNKSRTPCVTEENSCESLRDKDLKARKCLRVRKTNTMVTVVSRSPRVMGLGDGVPVCGGKRGKKIKSQSLRRKEADKTELHH